MAEVSLEREAPSARARENSERSDTSAEGPLENERELVQHRHATHAACFFFFSILLFFLLLFLVLRVSSFAASVFPFF